jgi:hypothetical protein
MASGHLGRMPTEVLDQLEEGDSILTQRLDSFFSWGMMYFGSSPIDHIAVYVGEGKILHMTLGGSKIHSISVFGRQTRVLPARLNYDQLPKGAGDAIRNPSGSEDHVSQKRRLSHRLPPKLQLVWVAIRIMLGLNPDLFRWKFFLDILLACALLDIPLVYATGHLVFVWIASGIFLLALFNLIVFKIKGRLGLGRELTSHPDMFLRIFFRHGGKIFPTAAATNTLTAFSPASASPPPTEPLPQRRQ